MRVDWVKLIGWILMIAFSLLVWYGLIRLLIWIGISIYNVITRLAA